MPRARRMSLLESLAMAARAGGAPVSDYSSTVMRIKPDDYGKLTREQLEMLRCYSERSWEDRQTGEFCFEVGSYRVAEIQRAGMVLASE